MADRDGGMVALTRTINEIGKSFELFKETNDERVGELKQKIDALEGGGAPAGLVATLRDRIEELEARAGTPGITRGDKVDHEHTKLFTAWLRAPSDPQAQTELNNYERASRDPVIRADVTVGTGSAGGFAMPKEIASEIERLEKRFSPVRDLVRVQQVGTGDYRALVNIRQSPLSGALSGWVGETGTRAATVTPSLREVVPTHGELYAYPQASNWSLDDIFFDVGQWLAEEVAQEFALQEGSAVLTGNGTNKPTGMTNSAPTSVADFASPIRAAAVYQFVASAASPDAILPDALITLLYTVASQYRANATWVFNSTTAAAIRKLKDTQNNYLWAPGIAAGQPDRLLGYPVAYWEQMADVGANTLPVAFGDFRRGYLLTHRGVDRVVRDEITTPGFTKFYVRRRVGGIPWNNDAIKLLKTT
jgi:HK97 family phage major capsid protein